MCVYVCHSTWVHVACVIWIPEVVFLEPEQLTGVSLSMLNKSRLTLKCKVCNLKGFGVCVLTPCITWLMLVC